MLDLKLFTGVTTSAPYTESPKFRLLLSNFTQLLCCELKKDQPVVAKSHSP